MTKVQQNTEFSKLNLKYKFKHTRKNPEWDVNKLISIEVLPDGTPVNIDTLRSCLLRNNAEIKNPEILISKTPKWLTTLEEPKCIDTGTGEIIYEDYETDDFKASRNRKIKTVEKFCNYYEPLYQARKVSLLFHTFTRLNYAKQDMRRMVDNAKFRYNSLKRPIRGYLWALELENKDKSIHIHYHFIVAIDRIQVKKIPEALKFQDLWGQRTGVEFIKKTIKGYLSKYLYKSDYKMLGRRSYSISRKLL